MSMVASSGTLVTVPAFRDHFVGTINLAWEATYISTFYIHRSGGLSEEWLHCRIAAELSDVIAHPLQRRDLIHQAVVSGRMMRRFPSSIRMREKSEYREPIIDRHPPNHAPWRARLSPSKLFPDAVPA